MPGGGTISAHLSRTSVSALQDRLGSLIERLEPSSTPEVANAEGFELPTEVRKFLIERNYEGIHRFRNEVPWLLTETPTPKSKPEALSSADLKEFAALRKAVEEKVINPTIRTESAAAWIGVGFYVILAGATITAVSVGASTWSTIASLAVGTGGAVAYLQPFLTNLTGYLRTRRMLLNIKSAWEVEAAPGVSKVVDISKQMQTFLGEITQMPSAYAGGASASKG